MLKINTKFIDKKKLFGLGGLVALIALSMVSPLQSQNLTQGYKTQTGLERSMLVAVTESEPDTVEPLRRNSIERFKGVVVQKNDTPITLSTDDRKTFVANSGDFEVLVSDENGEIEAGDYLTASSLSGIGMKADASHSRVVGRALVGFKGVEESIGTKSNEDNSTYHIGRIVASIGLNTNPLIKPEQESDIPAFLRSASDTIADKQVSPIRIYISAALFLATIGVVGFMLYGAVQSSINAIGRNPLSRATIFKGLVQVGIISVAIFITGMFGVYLLLKL